LKFNETENQKLTFFVPEIFAKLLTTKPCLTILSLAKLEKKLGQHVGYG